MMVTCLKHSLFCAARVYRYTMSTQSDVLRRGPYAPAKCCSTQAAAQSANASLLSFAAIVPVIMRLLLTVFRIFFPAKLKGIEPSFLTRQYLKSIKLG
jgi:hypothetical protein